MKTGKGGTVCGRRRMIIEKKGKLHNDKRRGKKTKTKTWDGMGMGRRSKKVKKSDEPVIEKRGSNDPNAENGNKDHHPSSCFINFLSAKLLRDSEGVGGGGGWTNPKKPPRQ